MYEAIRVCIKKNPFSNLNNNLNLREQGHDHKRDIHHIPSDGMARATQLRRLEQPLRQQIQRPQGHKPTIKRNKFQMTNRIGNYVKRNKFYIIIIIFNCNFEC